MVMEDGHNIKYKWDWVQATKNINYTEKLSTDFTVHALVLYVLLLGSTVNTVVDWPHSGTVMH
jgi:hypothetical protein